MAGLLKLEGWGLRQHKCLHSACRHQSVQSQSASDQKPQLAPVRCCACVEEGRGECLFPLVHTQQQRRSHLWIMSPVVYPTNNVHHIVYSVNTQHSRSVYSVNTQHSRSVYSVNTQHSRSVYSVNTQHSRSVYSVNTQHSRSVYSVNT